MSAFGTPKKAPPSLKKLTDEMLLRYRDNSELYCDIKAGYMFDGADTTITELGLGFNQITDVSALAQILPNTKITSLWLNGNQISDISSLAQVLPQTQITKITLCSNNISDVSTLVKILSQTRIIYLDLSENQISDADKDLLRGIKKNWTGENIYMYF